MVTVNVDASYQATGSPIPVLIVARNYDKSRTNIWWGAITVN